jgi:EAL domain-containing protein (putative c-di-GMP-specific phosphodiesterase class I)
MNPKKQLDDAIENAKEPIVIYFKLEDFNTLEEIYDNKTLENIQQKVAKYLELEILKYCKFDKVYQLGNGEYAMTNERSICVEDEELFIQKVEELQQHIQGSIINIDNIEYEISILASIVYSGTQVLESSKLGIRQLLQTKQNFIIANYFAQIEYDKAKENLKTISMVKSALEDGRVVSYFQPIIDNTTQEVIKYESLVRLIDSNNKVLSPYFFLDVSKKSKYYPQITYKVLANSFETLKNTTKEISMNLSALDIEKTTTRYKILELLNEYKEYASRVVFELLEDEAVKDFNTITKFIQDVKELGVQIAIDDFGSGYSNFERLLDYQPDILKIDGSLIKNIQTNKYSKSIVETIVAFAKKQKLKTIAEYVENEEIFNILKELGVDFSQGYYFGKPEKLD